MRSWREFGQNLAWFVVTLVVLAIFLRYSRSPVGLVALWSVSLIWGGWLAYKLGRLLLGHDELPLSGGRFESALVQAEDYQTKIKAALKRGGSGFHAETLSQQIDVLVEAIETLVARIEALRSDEIIRRDVKEVPQSIAYLESRLASANDPTLTAQLERALTNRRQQLDSLTALQNTMQRAEIQLEATLSQLGTIYSQLLAGQSASQVADYSRLAAAVDEEAHLLQDQLAALREVKLDGL